MKCKDLVLSVLFTYAFACTIVLMIYVQYPTIPGQIEKPLRTIDYNIRNSFTVERKANMNLIPIMAFEDLGVNKKNVMLLIIVQTAPKRFDRRQAIRDTWWKHCTGDTVQCVFITDGFILDHVQRNLTIHEKLLYEDIELQPLQGGLEFGIRFLIQIKWAMANFDFQFLLRIDDDYFLCLKRLLSELPLRPKENLVWGYFHCEVGITWIDEAFLLISQDMIHKFLSQNESTMLCHPYGDQMIGLWLENISTKQYFHDIRIHHNPPASYAPQFENARNVCSSYLGLHGTYAEKMRDFWKNSGDSAKAVHPIAIPSFSTYCKTMAFDHRRFSAQYRFDPKPCKDNPSWECERKTFVSREKG